MPSVIVIDDQSVSRVILSELVRSISDDIEVESFADPVKALDWVAHPPVDLVLTDFKMPHMDGVEFTRWLRQIPTCVDVPLVMITCVSDRTVRYRALEAGATDFLTKPIDHFECRARCRNLLKLRQQQVVIRDRARWLEGEVRETTRAVEQREKETLFRLARAGEYRDEDTGNHVLRVARFARLIADNLGLDPSAAEILEHAAPMHDIGKIGIPDRILLKPDRLTRDEWDDHEVARAHRLRDPPRQPLTIPAHGRDHRPRPPRALRRLGLPPGPGRGGRSPSRPASRRWPTSSMPCVPRAPTRRPWSIDQALDYLLGRARAPVRPRLRGRLPRQPPTGHGDRADPRRRCHLTPALALRNATAPWPVPRLARSTAPRGQWLARKRALVIDGDCRERRRLMEFLAGWGVSIEVTANPLQGLALLWEAAEARAARRSRPVRTPRAPGADGAIRRPGALRAASSRPAHDPHRRGCRTRARGSALRHAGFCESITAPAGQDPVVRCPAPRLWVTTPRPLGWCA